MKKAKKIIIAIIIVIIIISLQILADNNLIKTTSYEYKNEKIPAAFDDFRIVHISDLHNKLFGKNQKRLIEKIESLDPDIIVFTGDMVTRRETKMNNAQTFITKAVDICPVYYVEGNHEKHCPAYETYFKSLLEVIGVHTLRNKSERITLGGSLITICGVRDPVDVTCYGYEIEQRDEVFLRWLNDSLNEQSDGFKILLSHRPEYFEQYAEFSADLIFSGHAHGGQVILPFIGGVYSPNQGMFPKYYSGRYDLDSSTMFVNRGLGNSIIFPRINNRPEILCVTLKSE